MNNNITKDPGARTGVGVTTEEKSTLGGQVDELQYLTNNLDHQVNNVENALLRLGGAGLITFPGTKEDKRSEMIKDPNNHSAQLCALHDVLHDLLQRMETVTKRLDALV